MSISFAKGFGQMLEPAGFRRLRGRVWRREKVDVWQLIQLDHSPYDAELYIDLGVILKELWRGGEKMAPNLSHLHHRPKLGGLDYSKGLLKNPRELAEDDVERLRSEILPRVEAFFEAFDDAKKLRHYALRPDNIVPIPHRELRDWAGFDYSVWD